MYRLSYLTEIVIEISGNISVIVEIVKLSRKKYSYIEFRVSLVQWFQLVDSRHSTLYLCLSLQRCTWKLFFFSVYVLSGQVVLGTPLLPISTDSKRFQYLRVFIEVFILVRSKKNLKTKGFKKLLYSCPLSFTSIRILFWNYLSDTREPYPIIKTQILYCYSRTVV